MTIQVNSPRLHDVVDPEAEVEQVATGFEFTEGPVWNGIEGFLLFSDVSGDVTVRWSEDDGATDWRRPSGHANGLVYDADHRLVACEHDRSVVTRTELDGSVSVVASHYDGKELNSPNDVCVSSDGAVWFTDPHPSGRTADWGIERDAELDFRGVFRVTPGAAEPALAHRRARLPERPLPLPRRAPALRERLAGACRSASSTSCPTAPSRTTGCSSRSRGPAPSRTASPTA